MKQETKGVAGPSNSPARDFTGTTSSPGELRRRGRPSTQSEAVTLDGAEMAVVTIDPDGRIVQFAGAAERMLGLSPRSVGRSIDDGVGELFGFGLLDEVRAVMSGRATELRELNVQGRCLVRQVMAMPGPGGMPAGAVATFLAITELKRAADRLAERERQQAAIARLGIAMLETSDLQEFLDHVVGQVRELLATDYCAVLELQPGRERLLVRAASGWPSDGVGAFERTSRAGVALQSRTPISVADVSDQEQLSPLLPIVDTPVRGAAMCLIRDHDPYGILAVHTLERRQFSRQELQFLQAAGSVVGQAISQSVHRRSLAIENAAARMLGDGQDFDRAISNTCEAVARELGAQCVEVWWADAHGRPDQQQCIVVDDSFERRDRIGSVLTADRKRCEVGWMGQVWQTQQARWLTCDLDPADTSLGSLGVRTAIAVPIVERHRTLAMFVIYAARRLVFDPALLAAVQAVGASLGHFEHKRRIEIDRAHLAAVVDSSDDAILSTALDGTIQTWNPSCDRMYGYTATEAIGKHISLVLPEHSSEDSAELRARIANGERIHLETVRRRKDGTIFDASVTISPVSTSSGQIIGASTIARDITVVKQHQQRLRRADHQKNQFLAMLGHELRNPLAAVRSATELLGLVEHDDPRVHKTHAVLERQTVHMARLIDGLLDVARIIGGKIVIEKKVVDLVAIVAGVIDDSMARIDQKDLVLIRELPAGPLWIDADSVRIAQVLDNVLGNAIKFTDPPGTVTVRVKRRSDGWVELAVRDTGRGIDPQLLPDVFEVFRQADQSFDRGLGGMGLGLSLVKQLVELHRGRVRVHSDGRGKGAEFTISLPLVQRADRSD